MDAAHEQHEQQQWFPHATGFSAQHYQVSGRMALSHASVRFDGTIARSGSSSRIRSHHSTVSPSRLVQSAPPPGAFEPAHPHLTSYAHAPGGGLPPFAAAAPPGPPSPLHATGAPPAPAIVFKKCPGAPKRFKSSYVHFFTHFVAARKQRLGPDGAPVKIAIAAVSKECSRAWKALPEEQRQYWEYMSTQEKQEYLQRKAAYAGPWRVATKKVKEKKQGAPKRSPPAFFLYLNAKRPEIKAKFPDLASKDVVKACSEMWRASGADKAPYQREEQRLRAQYHDQKQRWLVGEGNPKQEGRAGGAPRANGVPTAPGATPQHSSHNDHGTPSAPGFAPVLVAAHRTKKRKKDPHAPKKSPPAFFLFANHCRPELKRQHPALPHNQLIKLLARKWSEMAEEERTPFRRHEEQLRQQYHRDLACYKQGAGVDRAAAGSALPRTGETAQGVQHTGPGC